MSMPLPFVWFGIFKHFVHWKNKGEGRAGQLANKAELEREERIRAMTTLLTFDMGLEILWLCT